MTKKVKCVTLCTIHACVLKSQEGAENVLNCGISDSAQVIFCLTLETRLDDEHYMVKITINRNSFLYTVGKDVYITSYGTKVVDKLFLTQDVSSNANFITN